MGWVVGIGGLAGTGTSTLARQIAETYECPLRSGGEAFRMAATARNLRLEEFEKLALRNPEIDAQLELDNADFVREHHSTGCVLEARLPFWATRGLNPHHVPVLMILLTCDDPVRFERIWRREQKRGISLEQARFETLTREGLIQMRYKQLYRVDCCASPKWYNLVIDTTTLTEAEVFQQARSFLLEHLPIEVS